VRLAFVIAEVAVAAVVVAEAFVFMINFGFSKINHSC